jgi:hypothetical protein
MWFQGPFFGAIFYCVLSPLPIIKNWDFLKLEWTLSKVFHLPGSVSYSWVLCESRQNNLAEAINARPECWAEVYGLKCVSSVVRVVRFKVLDFEKELDGIWQTTTHLGLELNSPLKWERSHLLSFPTLIPVPQPYFSTWCKDSHPVDRSCTENVHGVSWLRRDNPLSTGGAASIPFQDRLAVNVSS